MTKEQAVVTTLKDELAVMKEGARMNARSLELVRGTVLTWSAIVWPFYI